MAGGFAVAAAPARGQLLLLPSSLRHALALDDPAGSVAAGGRLTQGGNCDSRLHGL
jgi:hypothetical protein